MKTYTGIELLQAIKDGEIERDKEFLVGDGTIVYFDGSILRHRNNYCGTPKNTEIGMSWLTGNFKLLDDNIDIQSIEELKQVTTSSETYKSVYDNREKINEIVEAVKQLDRQINNK